MAIHTDQLLDYLNHQAALVVLEVSPEGIILHANQYASDIAGHNLKDTHLRDFFISFNTTLDLPALLRGNVSKQLLNISTFHKLPQTLYFSSFSNGETTTIVGEASSLEVEELRNTMVSLNNELNNLTRELQKKNIQLDQLNQLKNQFLGMAAHDLRNPIGTILMFTEFVTDEQQDCISEECMQMMEIIHNSSRFMLNLLDELLDVVKIESGKLDIRLEKIDVEAFLTKNIAINSMIATKKQIRIVKNIIEEIPTIEADPGKLEQVLNNLISNAIKYSVPGTTITLSVFCTGSEVIFSVADQGQGIPKEEMDLLFKPFAKLSPKGTAGEKSTGLGLTIVKRIIIGHMGRIWVESTQGKGTTVYFSLPVNQPQKTNP
jgi:signal transduction histidine kinase